MAFAQAGQARLPDLEAFKEAVRTKDCNPGFLELEPYIGGRVRVCVRVFG